MIKNLLLVGLGGGLGSMARYGIQRWVGIHHVSYFPWATFAVNITGCFLIGIFWGMNFRALGDHENWKLLLMTGLCGGYTTFSAFALEGIGLIKEQKLAVFFTYAAASLIIGLLATYIGIKITSYN